MSYHVVKGGLPAQSEPLDERAVFTEAYAVLPGSTMTDIVASAIPHWTKTRLWVIARPLSGFAETFSYYVMDVAPGGGSTRPDDDGGAEHVLFVVGGARPLRSMASRTPWTLAATFICRLRRDGRWQTTARAPRNSIGCENATNP